MTDHSRGAVEMARLCVFKEIHKKDPARAVLAERYARVMLNADPRLMDLLQSQIAIAEDAIRRPPQRKRVSRAEIGQLVSTIDLILRRLKEEGLLEHITADPGRRLF